MAAQVAAALGRDLVLDVQRGHASRLVRLHRAPHAERVAIAGVGVGDDRQVDLLDDVGQPLDDLAE